MRTRLLVVVLSILLVAGCDEGELEPTTAPTDRTATTEPDATPDALAGLAEPWRPAPLQLDDPNVLDAIAFVCSNPADPDLKAAMEHVPIAVADVRGDGLVSVILADEFVAFECRLTVERVGGELTSTILEPPSRLVPDSTTALDGADLSVVSHTRVDEETGSRTILIGRVGPEAFRVVVGFNDESEVTASKANGWFYAWWPGAMEPGAIVSLDNRSLVQKAVDSPAEQVEGRVGPAAWWIDPDAPPPGRDATTIPALIRERACASGRSPEGRVLDPVVFASDDAVLVTIWVRRPAGAQDCPGNPAFPLEIPLGQPLGDRRLLDGSEIPPRDATTEGP